MATTKLGAYPESDHFVFVRGNLGTKRAPIFCPLFCAAIDTSGVAIAALNSLTNSSTMTDQ